MTFHAPGFPDRERCGHSLDVPTLSLSNIGWSSLQGGQWNSRWTRWIMFVCLLYSSSGEYVKTHDLSVILPFSIPRPNSGCVAYHLPALTALSPCQYQRQMLRNATKIYKEACSSIVTD
jgi:hypothetical protein